MIARRNGKFWSIQARPLAVLPFVATVLSALVGYAVHSIEHSAAAQQTLADNQASKTDLIRARDREVDGLRQQIDQINRRLDVIQGELVACQEHRR